MTQKTEERRLLTTLFADLSGFTALSSKLDPEEVKEVASSCFELLNQPIVKHGGTIHKYEGDLVIALFGFPNAHEDDPERSINAAFEMMGLIPKINEVISQKLVRKTNLSLHIGINSGIVFVGEVGSKEKVEYTVMGDVVNLTARLKDVAKSEEIIVAEPVFRTTRYLFEYEACPPVSIKGVDKPVEVFKPLRIKKRPDPKRGIEGLHSPMVGRDTEFKLIKDALGKLQGGQGGACFISGTAGLGKTRLLIELKKLIASSNLSIAIMEARCHVHSETIPYAPFLQILKEIFAITDHDSRETVLTKLLAKSREMFADDWQEVLPYLSSLFSIRFADFSVLEKDEAEKLDEKIKYLEPKNLRIQLFLSMKKVFASLVASKPLLLVIEDYHWIDKESLELIEFIFASKRVVTGEQTRLPILFLGLTRVEKEKECYKTKENLKNRLGANFKEVILNALDADAGTRLIYNLLNIPGITEKFKDKILDKAEGNPFYVEEIIRSLIDSGRLIFARGIWSLNPEAGDLDKLTIPDNIQAVIASRLDRLDNDLKGVLQVAAVIGRNFYTQILERLCGLESLILTVHLATLEDYEYISEYPRQTESEYAFRHPLLQEVIYNSLLKKKRKKLHRNAGEAIESIYHNRIDDFTELLAYQYSNSDDLDKAIEWTTKAGEKTKGQYANDEAVGFFENVIKLIKDKHHSTTTLPPSAAKNLCVAYEAIGDIYILKAEYTLALKYFEMMERVMVKDEIIQSRSRRRVADIYQKQGKFDKALGILDEVEAKLKTDSVEVKIEKAEICFLRSWVCWGRSQNQQGVDEAEKGLRIIDKVDTDNKIERDMLNEAKARGYNSSGLNLYQMGKYEKAIEAYQKFLSMGKDIGNKRIVGVANHNLSMVYSVMGEYDRALEYLQKSIKISEEIGDKQSIGINLGNQGNIYHQRADYEKAVELYQEFLKISEEIGYKHGVAIAVVNLGTVHKDKGDFEKAIELYMQKLSLSGELGDKNGAGIAMFHIGDTYLKRGDREKAQEFLVKSKNLFTEINNRLALINVYSALAELKILENDMAEAIKYADLAREFAEELKTRSGLALCYYTFGKTYTVAGEFPKSKEYFQKAIEIYKALRSNRYLADVYFDYALMVKKSVEKGVPVEKSADEYFNRALAIYRELKLPHRIKEVEESRK